jgi:hypothetical protein
VKVVCCGGLSVGVGRPLLPGLVGPVLVVVALVGGQDLSRVGLVDDQDMITQLVS